jgi:hypothetical protein
MSKIMRELQAEAEIMRRPVQHPRISVREGDPGYEAWLRLRHRDIAVYLNGKKLVRAVTADEAAGEVVVLDEPIRATDDGEDVVTKTLHGNVRVELLRFDFCKDEGR